MYMMICNSADCAWAFPGPCRHPHSALTDYGVFYISYNLRHVHLSIAQRPNIFQLWGLTHEPLSERCMSYSLHLGITSRQYISSLTYLMNTVFLCLDYVVLWHEAVSGRKSADVTSAYMKVSRIYWYDWVLSENVQYMLCSFLTIETDWMFSLSAERA